jgi:hypothetical protein
MTRLVWLAFLPLLWSSAAPQGPGPSAVSSPPASTTLSWRTVRASSAPIEPAGDAGRETLATPGIVPRPGLASPTRVPWVNTNGWRFVRNPNGRFRSELPAGKGALGVAEALAYGVDAAIRFDPADTSAVERLFAFVKDVPPADLPGVADFGVLDDGSPMTGEVMNLFVRRNLLFARLTEPSSRFPFTVKLGTPEYPLEKAADPSAFALEIRRKLTDEKRSFRVYGSEVVIARLTGDASRARLHLVNYGNRELVGLRLRVRGEYSKVEVLAPGGRVTPAEVTVATGGTELTLPSLQVYAIVDFAK